MKERVEGWYNSGVLLWWFVGILLKTVIEGGAAIIVSLILWLGMIKAIKFLPIMITNSDYLGILVFGTALNAVWDSFIEKWDE